MSFGQLTVETSSARLEEHMEVILLINATISSSLLVSQIILEIGSSSTVLLYTRVCAPWSGFGLGYVSMPLELTLIGESGIASAETESDSFTYSFNCAMELSPLLTSESELEFPSNDLSETSG